MISTLSPTFERWSRSAIHGLLSVCLGASLTASWAQSAPAASAGKTELLWLGQAGFRMTSPGGKNIIIDPWISTGPKAPEVFKKDLGALGKVDFVLVTHAHVDHLGDAPDIAKLNSAVLYGPADMITPLFFDRVQQSRDWQSRVSPRWRACGLHHRDGKRFQDLAHG